MQLWPHQAAAVEELVRHRAYGLWWEPGVGKTAPLAAAGRRVGGRQLWLTTAALRSQAAAEIARFRGDGAEVQVIRSLKDRVSSDAPVVVCSYEMARVPAIWKQLFRQRWASLVADEAHRLASPEAATTRAIYGARPDSKGALIRSTERVWLGTGTPVVNYPHELWTHVSRLWPDLCRDCNKYGEWRAKFCQINRTAFGVQVVGGKDLNELRRRWNKTGSRLKLVETQSMPPLTINVVSLDVNHRTGGDPLASLGLLPQGRELLQSCNVEWLEGLAPSLATERRLTADAKADAVAKLVAAELEGGLDRALVFGCHIDSLRAVHAALGSYRPGLVIGETSPAKREEAVARFKLGASRVLVGNVQALGTGLNIQSCRRIIFLDASWSPAQNAQAIGRSFRAGQQRPVQVSFCSVPGSVDEQVQQALARKAKVIQKLETQE